MSLKFNIFPGSGISLFQQIIDQIRKSVAKGDLIPGDSLPSIRSLAEDLIINPNTVAKAYRELSQEGTIESIQGIGFIVKKRRQVYSRSERNLRLEKALEQFVNQLVLLDFEPDEIVGKLKKKLSEIQSNSKKGETE